MWLFNQFPRQRVERAYGVKVDDALLGLMQAAAVRFNSGGTGSFVSADGLLFTNHHVASDCIQKLSSEGKDYVKDGFLARTRADERKCPDLEVNVLLKIEDVTSQVTAEVKASMPAAEANRVKKAAMSRVEKACSDSTGNRCDVVTLFSGAQYHLYQYKKYTDLRLVMAPEFGIAFFGGDPENFTFPRYDLDIAFFRAYENDRPVHVDRYFRWAKAGVKEGDLVFVPGNPGTTGRLLTMSHLEFSRDVSYPLILRRLESAITSVRAFQAQSEENKRIGQEQMFGLENSYKAYSGFLSGLRDPELMQNKREAEAKFREALRRDPAQAEKFARFWDDLATTYQAYRGLFPEYYLLESSGPSSSDLLGIAMIIVRYAAETRKPDGERLREYAESGLSSLEQAMFSGAPVYPALEISELTDYFTVLAKELGAAHPVVQSILGGRSPNDAARAYVENSKLASVDERKRLARTPGAVEASQDGMIRLALLLDPAARSLRKRYEDTIESVTTRAAAQIAQARFALYGESEYPDATFTLRVAYGAVRGYKDNAGKTVPYATEIGGLFPKGTGKEPYVIPESWLKAKGSLSPRTHFNFVSTADTHGGNSGSATLNSRGELVGILFDGNIESLPNRFVFTDRQSRSVHVSSEAILEALRKIYKAEELLKEMGR
jgi:hypothetical protein